MIHVLRRTAVAAATLALATTGSIASASAAPAHRVLVAGPDDDAIAARVQKELTALGFETLRVGALEGCARSAVVRAAQEESAIAAACSDGDQVGVWVTDGDTLRLKDVVVVREIECKRGEERKWRAIGADAAWQHVVDPDSLMGKLDPTNAKASSIVVSAGLFTGNTRPQPGTSFVIADGASVVPDLPTDNLGFLRRMIISDYPVGADDNRLDLAKLLSPRPPKPETVRAELARAMSFAVEHARSANAPVTIVRRRGLSISLEAP